MLRSNSNILDLDDLVVVLVISTIRFYLFFFWVPHLLFIVLFLMIDLLNGIGLKKIRTRMCIRVIVNYFYQCWMYDFHLQRKLVIRVESKG